MRSVRQSLPHISRLGRRSVVSGVLVAFAIVVVVVTFMVLTALGEVARHANQLDDERSLETTAGALKTFGDQLGATLNDYAAWDDAAQNVYAADGMDWTVSNYGDMTANSNLFDVAIVLGADNKVLLAYRNGAPMTEAVDAFFDKSLWKLVGDVRSTTDGGIPEAGGFVRTEEGIAALGVALIREKSGALDKSAEQRRLLIFARHLDKAKVAALSDTYVISGLHLASADEASRFQVAIRNPLGELLGTLVWTSRSPGDISFAEVRPTVLLAVAVIGLFFVGLLAIGWLAAIRLKAEEAQARQLSQEDRLSGLLNRTGLFSSLETLIAGARHERSDVLLLYLDLDGFKDVNDAYGHATGDQLIRGVAAGLAALVGSEAKLARLGGDEFAIIMATQTIDSDAARLTEDILRFFSEPFSIGDRMATVGCSIGVASSPRGLVAHEELVRRADMAMYRAKETGRGRCVQYDIEMDHAREERNAIELDLRAAIEQGQLTLVFQPIVDAKTHIPTGVEALVRWSRPNHGPVSPDEFIPVAERTGLIEALGLFVLREACDTARRWPGMKLSVNVSPGQFRNPAFTGHVAQVLEDSAIAPHLLTLELTEGYFIQNATRARHSLDQLKALGIKIALDDFGAGFSSVGYLRQFGFDRMKIDRSLIAALDASDRAADMLQATVALARSLDIPATAEGIEREDQAIMLQMCGCDELQGYFFGKPMSAEDIDRLIDDNSSHRGNGSAAA
jgi:diguanylate cyclase (GGDEF)-like protein